jgi:hypothetical protein
MCTVVSIATPHGGLRVRPGATPLRIAPRRSGSGFRVNRASLTTRAIGGKNDQKTEGKKDQKAKGTEGKKAEKGKTGTAIGGASPLPNLPVPLPVLAKILGARKGSRGSVTSLEERGALDENRYVDDDKFFSGMMKTVRTVEMPELTSDQIKAARERRRQSRDVDASPSTLDNVELPANHPFATTAKVSESERKKLAERVREMNKPRTRQRGTPPPKE